MDWNKFPLVRIEIASEEEQKFVVVVVEPEKGVEKKLVWSRITDRRLTHDDIFHSIWSALGRPDYKVECIGGGKLRVDAKKKKILLWNSSVDFGREPDRQETANLIKASYPEYEIEVSKY